MTKPQLDSGSEPVIAVGLVEKAEDISFRLLSEFVDASGSTYPAGEYKIACTDGTLTCQGRPVPDSREFHLSPVDRDAGRFSLEATIGIDFHWQQTEVQTFNGALRFVLQTGNRVTAINDVPLETYILSVICSEMSSSSPPDLVKAHAVVSRSWLLAQMAAKSSAPDNAVHEQIKDDEITRWYDHQAHAGFDVCADDHCQRYQGVHRISESRVYSAIQDTSGQVLTHLGKVCDARFSKSCGGVTEDFRLAWSDEEVPYLVPLVDGPDKQMPRPPLTDEAAARESILSEPDVYCNCSDERILKQVLVSYDQNTRDFFRWQVKLTAAEGGELLKQKLGLDFGALVAIQPVERGLSGRLKRVRLTGEKGSVVIGKELEIRRALSPSHLYSSAFVVDTVGPEEAPDEFILKGAGWGHGVGLCQIGAAAMAWQGISHADILQHYYPGTQVEQLYQ